MDNPGAFSLGDFNIGTPVIVPGRVICNLAGMSGLVLQARFAYGGGGTDCIAYVQTSLDQGQTWCDIACFAFGIAGGVQVVGLAGAAASGAPIIPTDGSLANNTAINGLLGDRLRGKIVTTGTYVNSTLLSLWGVAR